MYRPEDDPELKVLDLLGEGGTAKVVRAFHHRIDRTIAVKYGRDDIENPDSFTSLARREKSLIGGHRFGGLTRLLTDPADNDERLFLELCEGPTLDQVGRIDELATALNVLSATALALEYLRACDLIHGDFKPQNVFLPRDWEKCRDNRLFFVRLSDFSLGRRIAEPENARLGLGTIGFAAPETVSEGVTSHRSDLFALGVIAYQVLTGQHPFINGDTDAVLINSRVREHTPLPVSELRADLPKEVTDLVTRLLGKQPEERPETGWEVCEILESAGAAYPFRRALQPGLFILREDDYESVVNRHLDLEDSEIGRLAMLSEERCDRLRLILTANARRGNLKYDGHKFQFGARILWPHCLRRRTLGWLSKQPYSIAMKAMTAAVTGDWSLTLSSDPGPDGSMPRGLSDLLPALLRPVTIRRISSRLARTAEHAQNYDLGARLRLQAGELIEAERLADLAARQAMNGADYPRAIGVLRKVELAARTLGREFEIRRALILRGNAHKDCGELDRADQSYARVIDLYCDREPDKLLAETYKHRGEVYRLRQDSRSALASLEKSLEVFRELGDELEISHTLTNIGNVHWLGNNLREAMRKYRAAYKIQKRLGAREDVASTLHNLATIFLLDGRLDRGIFLLGKTLEMKKDIGHAGEIARTLNNLGYAYQVKGVPSTAADYLAESLELNRRIGSTKEILYNIENLASLRTCAGQLAKSTELIEEGIALAGEKNLDAHLGTFWLNLATIARRRGDYREAEQALGRVDDSLKRFDEYGLELLASVERAGIRLQIGDYRGALEVATETYTRAKTAKVSRAELECLLLLSRLTGDTEVLEAATAGIQDQHLVREALLLSFSRAEFLIRQQRFDDAFALVNEEIGGLVGIEEDIEVPRLNLISAHLLTIRGDETRAASLAGRALRTAQQIGLVPETISALMLQGGLWRQSGAYEESYAAYRQALRLAKQVIGSITDPQDQRLYRQTPEITSMAREIKSLGEMLGQRQGAGR